MQQWNQTHWQGRCKPIWGATQWQDIARGAKPFSWVENLAVKVCREDAPVPEYDHGRSPEQLTGGQSTNINVSMVDLDWQYNGELFLDQ